MGRRKREGTDDSGDITANAVSGPGSDELCATRLLVGNDEYVVLSMPLATADVAQLTSAEEQVACLVLEGYSNPEIAESRGTSTRTVANQIASIYRKLAASSRAELAVILGGRARRIC